MRFKSNEQPYCRSCGKRIAKFTSNVYVKDTPSEHDRNNFGSRYVYGRLLSKADCQRHSNHPVLSVKYTYDYRDGDPVHETRRVYLFTEWDGETYNDEFFCSGTCAKNFGYFAAKHNAIKTKAWVDARSNENRKIIAADLARWQAK